MLRSPPVTAAVDATLVPVTIPGPAGELEGLLRSPAAPAGVAVVAHPHPRHGGTMHTKVVHRAAKLLSERFLLAALRFNFRGVGASAGAYDEGIGETEDLVAAGRWVRAHEPHGPCVLAGFSFGSLCALRAAPRLEPDVLVLIGLPVDRWDGAAPAAAAWPVVWIQGEDDEFSPPGKSRAIAKARGWTFLSRPGRGPLLRGKARRVREDGGRRARSRLGDVMVGEEEKEFLRRVARAAAERAVGLRSTPAAPPGATPSAPSASFPFEGIFVTWSKQDRPRGRSGTVSPETSLAALVEIHAVAALLHDPRVPPATAKELPRYAPRISVLSAFEEISSSSEITVGIHGVLAEKGKRSGIVLPEDAEGLDWDGERLLGQACLRAGLPEESWRAAGSVRLRRFTAETF